MQAAILLGAGLQSKSFEELEKELGLPVSQLLAAAQQEQQALWLEGEGLSKYAIRGTDDDWAAALPQGRSAVPPKHLSVKGEARPTDKPAKKGGKSEGGSKASKGSKGGSGKGGGDRKPKRQKQ